MAGRGRGALLDFLSKVSNDSAVSDIQPKESDTSSDERPLLSGLQSIQITEGSNQTFHDSSGTSGVSCAREEFYIPDNRTGRSGTAVELACNYIPIQCKENMGVYMYEVKFNPTIDSKHLRFAYLNEHSEKFGGVKTFDGVILYLPILLPETVTKYYSKCKTDGSNIEIRITYKKQESMKDCIHLYNVLFNRVMKVLKYVQFSRKHFDPTAPKFIPQAKLEVWPGYVTAVNEFSGGLMLCCDISHRLLNTNTVLEELHALQRQNTSNFQNDARKMLLGSVVLTKYNNRSYRIDEVNFKENPESTFMINDEKISYSDYFRKNYNIRIKDLKQPLLESVVSRKDPKTMKKLEMTLCLIPELCVFSGLRDTGNMKLMREVASFTRVSPGDRIKALERYYKQVTSTPAAVDILKSWGLSLKSPYEKVSGRILGEENIVFASKTFSAGPNGDFSKYAVSNLMIEAKALKNWLVLHVKNDQVTCRNFTKLMATCTSALGMQYTPPKLVELPNDRLDTYVNALRENLKKDTDIVVCICPSSRDDRYNAIKKMCCYETPVPSQVINARTLSNETKNRSIVQKIALQMNCKMGGSLWSVEIPFDNVMICGIDSYHDPGQKSNSIAGFVASMDNKYTKWYSKTIFQSRGEEIVTGLCNAFVCALKNYEILNRKKPKSIILYRDGVGDGQLPLCISFEIPQLSEACKKTFPGYDLKMSFIVVQKRINTRFLKHRNGVFENPGPGTVLDHTITRKWIYDFYLVPQAVRQGTVTPARYIVLKDDSNYRPDILQRLTYKLCYLYYNWPGTIRVPACCQYAHKLAGLVGENIKRQPAEKLSNQLFYL